MRSLSLGRFLIAATGLALLSAVFIAGCGSDTNGPATSTGTLSVRLVDRPSCVEGLEHLYLVLGDVRVHRESDGEDSGEWYSVMPDSLSQEERTVDLLELVNGVSAQLGEEELPAGLYNQARLVLEDAWMVIDGDSVDVFVPSGTHSGLKLIGEFTVDPGVVTELTVDWDACRSLHEAPPHSGRWILRPVLHTVQTILSGSVSGTVLPLDIQAAVMAVSADRADTMVTLVDPLSGGYRLMALTEGLWDLTAFAPGYVDSTITGVAVTAGEDTPDQDFTLVDETP